MTLTVDKLIACGIGPTQARAFVDPLNAACALFAIDSPARLSAFLGQCMVESLKFVHLEEDLYYSDPNRIAMVFRGTFRTASDAMPYAKNPKALANKVYANRNGNGDEASGDGFIFRGRGALDVTGRANYAAAASGCQRPYIDQPDLVAQPSDAALSAAWFWSANGLNALADSGSIDAITRRINGPAMLDAALRRQYTEQALQALQ